MASQTKAASGQCRRPAPAKKLAQTKGESFEYLSTCRFDALTADHRCRDKPEMTPQLSPALEKEA
jgi:hypothetical protein